MPLKDFIETQRGVTGGLLPASAGTSLIEQFRQQQGSDIVHQQMLIEKTQPFIEPEKKPSKIKTGWQWVSKQLMKPVGVIAAEVEALGVAIRTGEAPTPFRASVEVLRGKRMFSFSQLWVEQAERVGINPRVAGAIGFATDIVADPLNFIGGGLTKTGKVASKVTSLTKAGKKVIKGSKLAKQITKLGLKADDLVLASTKAEQVLKGQRAFLQAFSKPLIGGAKMYDVGAKAVKAVGITKAGRVLRETFTTKSGIKALDEMIDNYKNLSSFRKRKVVETAVDIQNSIKKMNPTDIRMVAEAIENPLTKKTIQNKTVVKVADRLEDLFQQMKKTETVKGVLKTELENYFPHIKAKEKLVDRIKFFFNPKKYSTALKASKKRKIAGTVSEINQLFGVEFFESNPAIAYAQRGLGSAKAVTAKELLDEAGKKFFVNSENAPIRFIESTNPLFKGLRAEPEVVRAIDQYIIGIQPPELKIVVKSFDRMQNWWKGQALISPSYHIRNMVGNFWNNWLAGVRNPVSYAKARAVQNGKKVDNILMVTDAGETLTRKAVMEGAQRRRVIGKGLYGADITRALSDEIGGIWGKARRALMPWEQENVLFRTNRAVGSAIEDNARLAHFIEKVQKGFSMDDAARSVKKFLFDYEDLSKAEKTIFKRIVPFYTWTRKNIPLQIENLIQQPEVFAAIPKVIQQIEAGVDEPRNEKYMSKYITDNVPVRIRTNPKGNTEYFLLGNWLPSAQAIDFLSQPIQNIVGMVTPFIKTPLELWSNKSTFFKNTLGEPSEIEYYFRQPTEFISLPMRRKAAHLLRNIRVLNDFNKLVKTPAKDEPENSWTIKLLNVLFGKAATYDIKKSRYFYQRDTDERIRELEAAIKKAKRLGKTEHARNLILELRTFKRER